MKPESGSVIRKTTVMAMAVTAEYIKAGDTVIDATAGNGNDTVTLSRLVGAAGKVYAFDVQETAIERTRKLLAESVFFDNVVLIRGSHENMAAHVEEKGNISAAVFNLGYLPRADKSVMTSAAVSVAAIGEAAALVKKGGVISIVMYPGTGEGLAERDAILEYAKALPAEKYHVCRVTALNQTKDPPEIIWIEVK